MFIENPIPWPDGARCAVAITYDLDADSVLHIAYPETADTYVSTQSNLRYGPEKSIPRICRLYEHFGIKQTFFVPGWCVERYPGAMETIVAGGHEVSHHGYLHESPNQQSEADERYWFERALAAYDKCLGIRPRGYRAPLNEFSKQTLPLLIEAGIEYDSSLMGDDVPYLLNAPGVAGDVLEIPQAITNDDYPYFMHNWDLDYQMPMISPRQAKEIYLAEFDAAWTGGGFWMSIWHPMLWRPSRAMMLKEMIEYMLEKGGVWFATMGEINDHVRACIRDGAWSPRTDIIPFDQSPVEELSTPQT